MKQLLATDFDGTFYIHGQIPPENRAGIEAWRANGRRFGFVTGRDLGFFKTIGELALNVDYLLLYNGALLALADGTVVKEYLIDEATFRALEAFISAMPDVCSCSSANGAAAYHQYYATFPDQARALAVADAVNARFGDAVTAFVNGEHVNIGVKGSGKTQGVLDALEYYGLSRSAAAVFGDDYNDVDMIKTLDGWAVETARPAVKRAAPHICKSVGEAALKLLEEA